ncbi:MAG: radical SAM protein [Candidatus Eremiobacteraeota bacterium]|nr:radical SAM protein [Candidatus Eremiobacteraeota bacterium]
MRDRPNRFLTRLDRSASRPVHAVWEITLACDLKCGHCGSRAGKARTKELSTEECLQVVAELAALGTREVTLIGGEAYLRRDFAQIIAAVRAAGMQCTLQSGGRNLNDARIAAAVEAGLTAAGISLDGTRALHDELRGVRGSFDAAVAALHRLREHGLPTSVNTQITAHVLEQLDDVLDVVIATGAKNWQLQLTVPMGRAGDHPEMILQPYQMLEMLPKLAALFERAARSGVLLQIGNNVGYFGPHEGELRGNGFEAVHYEGCLGGQNTIGIEADGTVKGCPSLPTDAYAGGNVREIDLTTIWLETPELSFSRERREPQWGFCKSCYYKDVCRGGCTWMAHSLLGKPGNNPFCHHRALELERQGLRERIRQVAAAPGTPFDHGRFELIVETRDSAASAAEVADSTPRDANADRERLVVCYGCRRHVFAGTTECPFCGASVEAARERHAAVLAEARAAAQVLLARLSALERLPAR